MLKKIAESPFLVVISIVFISLILFNSPVYASSNYPKNINLLILSIIPPDSTNPLYIDGNFVPEMRGFLISRVQSKISDIYITGAQKIIEGSSYKKYKNNLSFPSVTYTILQNKTYLEPVKLGFTVPNQTTKNPDYIYYLNRENICDLVDNKNIREVWFFTNHNSVMVPVESNMSMGTSLSKFFNHTTYGDISNSWQTDDLPACKNTYTVYNYNYTRGVGEFLESYAHQLERLYNYLDQDLFWVKFVGSTIGSSTISNPGCGNVHYPPNGIKEFDWYNKNYVQSDCPNWNPDRTGVKESLNCLTWDGPTCFSDIGTSYKVWWMQNLPGKDNGLSYGGRKLTNWWSVVYDFDKVLYQGSKLYQPLYADVNLDGKVDYTDSKAVLNQIMFNNQNIHLTDVNSDLNTNLIDLVEVLSVSP